MYQVRISFQIAFVVFIGFGAIYAGVNNLYSPSDVYLMFYSIDLNEFSEQAKLAIEIQTRLLAGMWISAGIFSLIIVNKFESNTNAIRLILLGLALGAIGELISIVTLEGELQPAIIKTSFQVVLCLAMEFWRAFLCKKAKIENLVTA